MQSENFPKKSFDSIASYCGAYLALHADAHAPDMETVGGGDDAKPLAMPSLSLPVYLLKFAV